MSVLLQIVIGTLTGVLAIAVMLAFALASLYTLALILELGDENEKRARRMKTFDIIYPDGREFLSVHAYSAHDAIRQISIAFLGRLCGEPVVVRRL